MTILVKGHFVMGKCDPKKTTYSNPNLCDCFHAVYPYSSRAGVTKPSSPFIYKGMASSKDTNKATENSRTSEASLL